MSKVSKMDILTQSKWARIKNVAAVFTHRFRVQGSRVRTDFSFATRGTFLPYSVEIVGATRELERIELPSHVGVQRNVTIFLASNSAGRFRIGLDVFIGQGCFFTVHNDLTIGHNVMIGPYCYIASATHVSSDLDTPMVRQGIIGESVTIEDDVWIGTGVTVLPGVQIGKGSIVGAGSVVTKAVPPGEIWAGVPAARLRARGDVRE